MKPICGMRSALSGLVLTSDLKYIRIHQHQNSRREDRHKDGKLNEPEIAAHRVAHRFTARRHTRRACGCRTDHIRRARDRAAIPEPGRAFHLRISGRQRRRRHRALHGGEDAPADGTDDSRRKQARRARQYLHRISRALKAGRPHDTDSWRERRRRSSEHHQEFAGRRRARQFSSPERSTGNRRCWRSTSASRGKSRRRRDGGHEGEKGKGRPTPRPIRSAR